MEKKLLVIIINFNGLNDTIECIESLHQSNQGDAIDILVIDNGSRTDESTVLMEMFPSIITKRINANMGYGIANNIGIRFAKENGYEYVLLLNNDTVIEKNMITRLLEADNGCSLCVPKMYYYDEPQLIWYGGGWISKVRGNGLHKQINKHDLNLQAEAPQKCTFATMACVLIKTNIFDTVGPLDEDFFLYGDDTEFCLRLVENKIDIIYVPAAKLWHKVGRSAGGAESPVTLYYGNRNRLLFVYKHRDYFSSLAVPYILTTRCIRIIQYMLTGKRQWRSIVKGIRDYYAGVRGMVDKYE